MTEANQHVDPYRPSALHSIYRRIDRLPGPYWLLYVVLLLITGLANQLVAWNQGAVPFGEVNWQFAFTGFFLSYCLFANDFLLRTANDAIVEFRPLLGRDGVEYRKVLFEFTHFRSDITAICFITGAIVGLVLGIYLFPIAPEMNPAFPELEIPLYSLTMGLLFVTLYSVLRSLRLITRLFSNVLEVDLFALGSIYAISRYSAWAIVIVSILTYAAYELVPSLAELAPFLVFVVFSYSIVLAMFWLPLRGMNRQLIMEKRKLIEEVNKKTKEMYGLIHKRIEEREFDRVAAMREAVESLRLEREHLESIRTWPWKTETVMALITAFALPLLVGLAIEVLSRFFN